VYGSASKPAVGIYREIAVGSTLPNIVVEPNLAAKTGEVAVKAKYQSRRRMCAECMRIAFTKNADGLTFVSEASISAIRAVADFGVDKRQRVKICRRLG
jgi:hypothetical protein